MKPPPPSSDQPTKRPAGRSDMSPSGFRFKGIFTGRLNRLGYLMANLYWGLLAAATCIILLVVVKYSGGSQPVVIACVILGLIALLILEAVAVGFAIRRLHDVNQSAWLVVLLFLPIVSYVVAIFLYFAPGTDGPNVFGNSPQASLGFRDVSGF